VIVFLNIDGLYIEAHYCAKITLERLENFLAIVVLGEIFWGLATNPDEQVGAN
jgi:hypothetical protein